MVSDETTINRYGAKFFIGQLVKVKTPTECFKSDKGKVGVINAIDGSIESGFDYSFGVTNANVTAWWNEDQLDFVSKEEKEEWNENGKRVRALIFGYGMDRKYDENRKEQKKGGAK